MAAIGKASLLMDVKLEYAPVPAVETQVATDATFKVVPKLTAAPIGIGTKQDPVSYKLVGDRVESKIPGVGKYDDIEIKSLYVFGIADLDALRTAQQNGTMLQFRLTSYEDATKTNGVVSVFNGYVAGMSVEGGQDGSKIGEQKFNITINRVLTLNAPTA